MKKINYKKLLTALLWVITIAGLGSSLAFVSASDQKVRIKNISVFINNDDNYFLTEKDVESYLMQRCGNLIGSEYSKLNLPSLETALNAHPAIENAEVCSDMNGEIRITIQQRSPVCRIINADGESYYIDTQSKLMPLNENYSSRVVIVSGNIHEPYARRCNFSVEQIANSKSYSEVSMLDDVLQVVKYINADTTLSALIHQIQVNADNELELFPAVGGNKIILGTTALMEEKFNKLKLFYTQGLNKSDSWTKYSIINLKFKNLVVCAKK